MNINKATLSEQIINDLKQRIFHGELIPGQKLPISELREYYNVSSTPIRDALMELVHMGFVTTSGSSTYMVPLLSYREKEQLLDTYDIVTPATTDLFMKNVTREQAIELHTAAYDKLIHSEQLPDIERMRLYADFYNLILENCQNPFYERMVECWQGHLVLSFGNYLDCFSIDEAIANAHDILEAICAWDKDAINEHRVFILTRCRLLLNRQAGLC